MIETCDPMLQALLAPCFRKRVSDVLCGACDVRDLVCFDPAVGQNSIADCEEIAASLFTYEGHRNQKSFRAFFKELDRIHGNGISNTTTVQGAHNWADEQAKLLVKLWTYVRRSVMRPNETRCLAIKRLREMLGIPSASAPSSGSSRLRSIAESGEFPSPPQGLFDFPNVAATAELPEFEVPTNISEGVAIAKSVAPLRSSFKRPAMSVSDGVSCKKRPTASCGAVLACEASCGAVGDSDCEVVGDRFFIPSPILEFLSANHVPSNHGLQCKARFLKQSGRTNVWALCLGSKKLLCLSANIFLEFAEPAAKILAQLYNDGYDVEALKAVKTLMLQMED